MDAVWKDNGQKLMIGLEQRWALVCHSPMAHQEPDDDEELSSVSEVNQCIKNPIDIQFRLDCVKIGSLTVRCTWQNYSMQKPSLSMRAMCIHAQCALIYLGCS